MRRSQLDDLCDAPQEVKEWLRTMTMKEIKELALRAHLEGTETPRGKVSVEKAAGQMGLSMSTVYRLYKNGRR